MEEHQVHNHNLSEKKRFSIVAQAKSFSFAFRGLKLIMRTQHNFCVQICIAIMVIIFGFLLKISEIEWLFLILSTGIVIMAESFNTAFEFDIDLTSPTYHPYAKDTKDVAAGAVLISVITAVIVGLIIFIPRIIDILK